MQARGPAMFTYEEIVAGELEPELLTDEEAIVLTGQRRALKARSETMGCTADGSTWLGAPVRDSAYKLEEHVIEAACTSPVIAAAKLDAVLDEMQETQGELSDNGTYYAGAIQQVRDFLTGASTCPGSAFESAFLNYKVERAKHLAAVTAYSKIESCVFKGEIAKDDPAYVAAEEAEGGGAIDACAALGALVDLPAPDLPSLAVKLRTYVDDTGVLVDGPVFNKSLDEHAAIGRILSDLERLAFLPAPEPTDADLALIRMDDRRRLLEQQINDMCDAHVPGTLRASDEHLVEEVIKLEDLIKDTAARTVAGFAIKAGIAKLHASDEEEPHESYGVALARSLTNELAAHPRASHPDAHLLRLGEELERRWLEEEALEAIKDSTDEQRDVVCDFTGLVAHQIASTPAKTLDGMKVKARAIAWCWSDRSGEMADFFEQSETGTDRRFIWAMLRELLGTAKPDEASIWKRLDPPTMAFLVQRLAVAGCVVYDGGFSFPDGARNEALMIMGSLSPDQQHQLMEFAGPFKAEASADDGSNAGVEVEPSPSTSLGTASPQLLAAE